MKAKAGIGLAFTLALSLALMAQNAQELYQRGLVQEHSKGNLSEAIKLYSEAARTAGKDRALAAKALIRIATSEEKRGHQREAADAYTEVIRSYPEQNAEATLAQDRLSQLSRLSPSGSRQAQIRVQADVSGVTGPLFESYCATCHNASNRSGGLDLGSLNGKNISAQTAIWEKILRRLRARRDPPPNSPRPDNGTYRSVVSTLEQALDGAYSSNTALNLADYVTWRKSNGAQQDYQQGYAVWRENFSTSAASALTLDSSFAAVPEPASWIMLAVAMIGMLLRIRH